MQPYRPAFLFMVLTLAAAACGPVPARVEKAPSAELETGRPALTATAAPVPTVTVLPAPSAAPASSVPFSFLRMFNSLVGWAWDPQAGDEHIWRTGDGGLTWNDVTPQTMEPAHAGNGDYHELEAWIAVCGLPDDDCGLARTSDGGQTWTVISNDAGRIFDYAIRFFDERKGILETAGVSAGTASFFLKESDDGGVSWRPVELASVPSGAFSERAGEIEICNICGDTLYVDPDRLLIVKGNLSQDPSGEVELLITTDRGRAWDTLELPLPAGRFERSWIDPWRPMFPDPGAGILPLVLSDEARLHSAIAFYGTEDGGSSWTFQSLLEDVASPYQQMEAVSAQDLFLRCDHDLCVTHDGARTWERVDANLDFREPAAETYVRVFDFVDALRGWALVGPDKGAATLWQTGDGGRIWTVLAPVFASRFRVEVEYASGRTGILYSTSNCNQERVPWNIVYGDALYFQSTGGIPETLYGLLASFVVDPDPWWKPLSRGTWYNRYVQILHST